jgi:hypothetical protein
MNIQYKMIYSQSEKWRSRRGGKGKGGGRKEGEEEEVVRGKRETIICRCFLFLICSWETQSLYLCQFPLSIFDMCRD